MLTLGKPIHPLQQSVIAHEYLYFRAFQSFKEVLSLAPDFARRTEIHLRLGVMYKAKGHYSSSVDHFRRALASTGPASFSKQESKINHPDNAITMHIVLIENIS